MKNGEKSDRQHRCVSHISVRASLWSLRHFSVCYYGHEPTIEATYWKEETPQFMLVLRLLCADISCLVWWVFSNMIIKTQTSHINVDLLFEIPSASKKNKQEEAFCFYVSLSLVPDHFHSFFFMPPLLCPASDEETDAKFLWFIRSMLCSCNMCVNSNRWKKMPFDSQMRLI